MESLLCSACHTIFEGSPPIFWGYEDVYDTDQPHHVSSESFQAALELGCAICRRVHGRLGKPHPSPCTNWSLIRRPEDKSQTFVIIMAEVADPASDARLSVAFELIPSRACGPQQSTTRRLAVGPSTMSDEALSMAEKWYTDCVEQHYYCRSLGLSYQPTRLLHIGKDGDATIKLTNPGTSHANKPVRYATLSHRWGGADVPTLSSSTEATLRAGFSVATLPRTFHDAVVVARRLGISYIWIDSLCIMQDSEEDWVRESGAMDQVYGNGVVNIMATASGDSHGGLGRYREAKALERIEVSSHWDDDDSTGLENRLWHVAERDIWNDSISDAPLNRRGWVLQERALSPRSLHFAQDQLFWDCRCMCACETYPEGLPAQLISLTDRVKLATQPSTDLGSYFPEKLGSRARPMDEVFEVLWAKWIMAYSSCELTKRSDKMVAISGLAKIMRTLQGGRYLAGMWRRGFVQQMVWYALDPVPLTATYHREATGIPSWSWASLDTRIVSMPAQENTKYVALSEIIDVKTTPAFAEDDTGQLLGGELRIKGCVVTGVVTAPEDLENDTIQVDIDGAQSGGSYWTMLDVELEEKCSRSVVLLPILREDGVTESTSTSGVSELSIVLLEVARGHPAGYYRRAGLMKSRRLAGHASDVWEHFFPNVSTPFFLPQQVGRDIKSTAEAEVITSEASQFRGQVTEEKLYVKGEPNVLVII